MRKLIWFFFLCGFSFAQNNFARMLSGVNYQTGTTYTFVALDAVRVTSFNNAAPIAATLPSGFTFGFEAGKVFSVVNLGAGTVTITCTACTINGVATLALSTSQGADIYSDGHNYVALAATIGGGGGGISGATNAQDMVATGAGTATSFPKACNAAIHGSGDICADINWCYTGAAGNAVTTNSAGVIDATGYANRSNLVCNSNPYAGANRSGVTLLPSADIYTSVAWIVPQKKMDIIGKGQSSPLGSGNLVSEENTIIRPCTGVNTPVTGCAGSILSANNQIFVDPSYTASCTNVAGTTAVCTTTVNHNYTFTSGSVMSHIRVTGCSVTNYNSGSGGNPSAYFPITAATANTVTFTLGTSGNGAASGCTITAPARQHGRYSLTGSGLTNPGNYYVMMALGGGLHSTGYDGNGTCGTGPVGADWTLSAFGGMIENVAFSNDGLAGLISVYSGNEQERGGIKNVTFNNYGGLLAGQTEGNGFMFDRNSWNLNDKCANASGNGGPSQFIVEHIFCDAAPVSNPVGPGASDNAGICGHLAGNHSESNGTSVQDGGSVGGLANYGIHVGATVRGLNDSGNGKSNYGFWIENYDDGQVDHAHFENMFHDPVYIQGVSGWTAKGWLFEKLDFASSSGSNNAVVHLGTGTDDNRVIEVRGASGANPAAVRDEVNGCPGAFGAAAPCIVNGLVDGNPVEEYTQSGLHLPHALQLGNTATPASINSGTGAPSGVCVSGSEWYRTDGASPNAYDCINTSWIARGTVVTANALDQAGLLADYRMPPSEQSTTTLTDYSHNGNNGTFGATTHAPTRLANGSISCNAANTQFVTLPAAISTGPGKTWMFAYTYNTGDNYSGTRWAPFVAQNTTPNVAKLELMGFTATLGNGVSGLNNLINSVLTVGFVPNSNGTYTQGGPQGTHIITWSFDTVDHIYFDGVETSNYPLQQTSNTKLDPSPNNWQLCGGSFNTSWFSGQLHEVAIWNTALSASDVARNTNVMQKLLADKGVKISAGANGANSTTDNFSFDGDSIMFGFDDGVNAINPWQSTLQLTNSGNLWDTAIAGTQLISQQYPNLNINALSYYSNNAGRNATIINGGRNDLAVGLVSNAYLEGTMTNYCQGVHQAKGKCVLVSLIACNTGNCLAAQKNAVNAYYRLHWREWADMLLDWGGDPNIGCDTCVTNGFFRGDNIHPNSYSNRTILGHITQKGLNILFGPKDFTNATVYNAAAAAATTVTASSQTGNIATYTFGSNPFAAGAFVTCTGITPAGYNTTFRVLTSNATQITGWLNTTGLGAGSVFGSCSAPQQAEEAYSILNFGAGNFNLIPCDGLTGTRINIKNINAAGSTLNAYNTAYETDLIDGAATLAIAQNQVRILESVLATPATPVCSWKVIQ